MTKLILYLNDNEIQIIKNKLLTFTTPSINNSNIEDENIFLKDFKKFLKVHKLISSICYTPIDLYLNYKVYPKDIVYYNYLFDKLGLTLNKVIPIYVLLSPDKTYLIYNKNSTYLIDNLNTYTINKPYLDYYLSSIPKLFVFGNKEFSYHNKHIIYSNSSTYVVDLIKTSQSNL